MQVERGLMVGLFSPIPGDVSFSRDGEVINGAKFLVTGWLRPSRRGEPVDAAEDDRRLRGIAPVGTNGYVWYKGGLVDFYYVPEEILERFMNSYLERKA